MHKTRDCAICGKPFSMRGRPARAKLCGWACAQVNKRSTPAERAVTFWTYVEKSDGCWMWKGAWSPSSGYGRFALTSRRLEQAHRAAWIITNGPIADGLVVMHKCDVPLCVRPEHLQLGTRLENLQDAHSKGRHVHGERNWSAKLNDTIVIAMRQNPPTSEDLEYIAEQYGVGKASIQNAIARRTWKHLP